eukprot:CCRYP_015108-RA/>CCRYP_015108-RA protein AED:0.44 eAED:0.44 QI:0/0/0/1/0/0/2/0/89
MENVQCKARLVARGHATKAQATLTYTSIVSRETCRICPAHCTNVLNAYITVPFQEKIWTTLGKESGDNCGKKAIVVRALYGLKFMRCCL